MNYFFQMTTLLDVQTYYFMPAPGVSPEILERNLLRAYNTSQIVIQQALKLDQATNFLSFAPHFVYRSVLTAICIIMTILLSQHMKDLSQLSKDATVQDALTALKACSIQEGDLASRGGKILESYWAIQHLLPRIESPTVDIATFSHRLGTSLAFDCIRRFKRDIEQTRPTADSLRKQTLGTPSKPPPSHYLASSSDSPSLLTDPPSRDT
jgi:transcriptional regulatory protein LEU3